MEAFRLLTRSTNIKSAGAKRKGSFDREVPSTGQLSTPQLFGENRIKQLDSRKRKRNHDELQTLKELPLPDAKDAYENGKKPYRKSSHSTDGEDSETEVKSTEDQSRKLLASHKIKIMDLSHLRAMELVDTAQKIDRKPGKRKKERLLPVNRKKQKATSRLFPTPLTAFQQLFTRYHLPAWVLRNIASEGFKVPTEVQLGALPILLEDREKSAKDRDLARESDLLVVAPTGSGKTLAFLIALIADLVRDAESSGPEKLENLSFLGLVVAPTKELANQIVLQGQRLVSSSGIRLSILQKDDALQIVKKPTEPTNGDGQPLEGKQRTKGRPDIIVTTPQMLVNALSSPSEGSIANTLPSVRQLVLDEADVLLDPLFRTQTLAIWRACTNHSLRLSFWSATMGSSIESIVQDSIDERCKNLSIPNKHPLIRLVVGLKDSALPTVAHKLVYAATEAGKLLGLRQLLHPTSTAVSDASTPLRPPFLIFTQTIPRAIALHSELRYDIPASAGGSSRLAVLHSDLSDHQRADIMARFRKGQVWVLITTDLLSRGIDFRGVNGVVNYDIPTSSAAYVHRAGRTGRAGREGGICVTYYTKEDIPYVKNIANVIAASAQAGKIQGGDGSGGVQKWLLNALPNLSKNDKKELKRRGVKARRSQTENDDDDDAKLKRRSRISTKSGYDRKLEHIRKAVRNTRSRSPDAGDERDEEFEGFGD